MDRTHGTSGGKEKCVQGFVRIPEHIERLREIMGLKGRKDTIQIDRSEVRWDEVEWINLAEGADRVGLLLIRWRTYPPMKTEQSVPKLRHIKFRRRGITQKKAHNFKIELCYYVRLKFLLACLLTYLLTYLHTYWLTYLHTY